VGKASFVPGMLLSPQARHLEKSVTTGSGRSRRLFATGFLPAFQASRETVARAGTP
jgi:hypothetical protein